MIRQISIISISTFKFTSVNDCPTLDIICKDEDESIHIFIPDETRKDAFTTIIKALHSNAKQSQESCNSYAILIKHKIQESPTLQDFYTIINTNNLSQRDSATQNHAKLITQKLSFLQIFDFFADFSDTSPFLLFSILFSIISLLSFIFEHYSFGGFVCCSLLLLLIRNAFHKINGNSIPQKEEPMPKEVDESLAPLMESSSKLRNAVDARLCWASAQDSAEVAIFALVMLLMFVFLDPVFLLVVSALLLAFFERWDPLKIGSLPNILSRLILW